MVLRYAHTNKSFEDIVLKFLDVEDNMPLTSYLLEKLDSLDKGMTSQKTILCTWIVEIFLNRINALEDVPEDGSSGRPNGSFWCACAFDVRVAARARRAK